MADVSEGPILLVKKFGGVAFLVLGLFGVAFGYQYGSAPLLTAGIVALILGAGLLALKVIRRNPD